MTAKELKTLIKSNFVPVAGVNFSDANEATVNALVEYYKLDNLSPREIKANKTHIMALIEEVIDEVLPAKLEDLIGTFAEVKQFDRDAEVIFNIKNKGKRRARLAIRKGQRGGLYQSARLDEIHLALPTWTETVGVFVTLEEILLGKYTLTDLMDNILEGFVERMYVEVVEALRAATAPAANHGTGAGFVQEEVDKVIRVVAAYGQPMIFGFHNLVSKINNVVAHTDAEGDLHIRMPGSDLDELKSTGYIGTYKGVPVIKLPNYIVNEVTNAEWLLAEDKLFILPAGEKPVKVALKGDLHIQEIPHASGSEEWAAHKMLGVGLLLANNIGTYTDTDA